MKPHRRSTLAAMAIAGVLSLSGAAGLALADATPAPVAPKSSTTTAGTPEEHSQAATEHKAHAGHHKAMAAHHQSKAAEYHKKAHHKLAAHHEALAKGHEALAKEHEATAKSHDEESTKKPDAK